MAKSVVITGTSTGIGRACVERMASEGWTVYAGVRKEADGEDIVKAVAGDVRPVQLDVTNADHIDALVARLREELGDRGLDGLVNNAGVAEGGPIETVSDAAWRWHFDVNVFGLVNVTRECLPLVLAAKGRVVNIGSIGGRVSGPMVAPYSAGKFAVEAISESLRFEMADQGVSVACVEPGEIASAIWEKADAQVDQVEASLSDDAKVRYRAPPRHDPGVRGRRHQAGHPGLTGREGGPPHADRQPAKAPLPRRTRRQGHDRPCPPARPPEGPGPGAQRRPLGADRPEGPLT